MTDPDRRFWPYKPRASITWSLVILVTLLFIVNALKRRNEWSISAESETVVVIGLVVFSLLPILLPVLDIIIERGGAIGVGGVKIDFAQVSQLESAGFTVPSNIGVPGQPVTDSDTGRILDALKQATTCDSVVIDLENGNAWWETRLLVFLAGAQRFGKPHKVVFVGKNRGIERCFLGWGYPAELLPELLDAHPQYSRSYYAAQAAARQWELVEPVNPQPAGSPSAVPAQPVGIQFGLAAAHPWMAFDGQTGLPNPLLEEQLLASDLGTNLEIPEGPKSISLGQLRVLFGPVLKNDVIDLTWSQERQVAVFFDSELEYLAITQEGKYLGLASRLSLLSTFVRRLIEKTSSGKT